MLDLEQFASVEDAVEKVKLGQRYFEIGERMLALGENVPMNYPIAFWFSMISRAEGLHGAIAREIAESNPHAVFPLLRAFAEAVVLVNYVYGHPTYVEVLTSRPREQPKGGQKRKSIQALIDYSKKEAPGMKNVYAELSEATHFGATAMWSAHVIEGEDEDSLQTSWTNSPRWRSHEQALIACALTLEFAEAMTTLLHNFFEQHIAFSPPD